MTDVNERTMTTAIETPRARTGDMKVEVIVIPVSRDDENWLKHTFCWLDDGGHVRLDYRPVHLQPLSNEVSTIPPKERVY
jgi:succinate dehydrogenase/fumarate reductase flavoprotein subunit